MRVRASSLTLCVQKIISGFERKVWKAKPRFCSRHSCAGTSTTPLYGTGRFSSGGGIVNVRKIEWPLSSSADSAAPCKMIAAIVDQG